MAGERGNSNGCLALAAALEREISAAIEGGLDPVYAIATISHALFREIGHLEPRSIRERMMNEIVELATYGRPIGGDGR